MGIMSIFSKKKDVNNVEEQQVADYYTPVEEPVGELPVGTAQENLERENKYMFQPIDQNLNNNSLDIKFDDDKPSNVLTSEQSEFVNNGYYLTQNNPTIQVNPTASLFQTQQDSTDNTDGGYSTYYDEELPTNDDNIISNVDGSYSSVSNQSYEEQRVNEHKFFSTSVEEIDAYKNQLSDVSTDRKPVTASQNIWSIGRIDEPQVEEKEKQKVMEYNNRDAA